MISNPFASSLFWATFEVVASLLGVGLAGIGIAGWRRGRETKWPTLLRRWLVWAIIAPILTVAVLAGPIPTALLCGALALQAAREYGRLQRLPSPYAALLLLGCVPIVAVALAAPAAFPWFVLALVLGCCIIAVVIGEVGDAVRSTAATALGLAYLPATLGITLFIQADPNGGPGLLLAVALAVALSDIGAFVCGSLFGKAPLRRELSPNKTIEGAAGNLLGAAAGIALLGNAIPAGWGAPERLLLVLLIAVGAVAGDLWESLLKRTAGAKEAGRWLPGFGGLLDRIDSLLVVLPLVYALLAAGPGLRVLGLEVP